MLTRLLQLIGPPALADEERDRVARTLFVIQLTLLTAALAVLIIAVIVGETGTAVSVLLGGVITVVALRLNHHGHTRSSSYLMILVLLSLAAFSLLLGQGVHDTAITLYPVIIIVASLLLEWRAFSIVVAVIVITLGLIAYLEINRSLLIVYPFQTTWYELAILAVILIIAACAAWFLSDNLIQGLQRARLSKQALSEANVQLQQEIVERTQVEEALLQSKAISAAVAHIARQLLEASDWREQIQAVLAQLGQVSHATHVYVFENHHGVNGELRTSQRYEWVMSGFQPEIDDPRLQNMLVYQEELDDWYEPLARGEPYYSTSRDFSEHWSESLDQRGIKTLLDVPIFVHGEWWGIIGFDDCVNELAWSQVEINALRTAADILGAAIQRQRIEAQLREREERYRLISEVISDYTFSTLVDAQGVLHLNWVAGAFERIAGYAFEEYVARGGWLAALHPDDVAQDVQDMAALRANHPVITEVRTISKNGAVHWVRVYAHPVWDEAEARLASIYGAVQDITERKQAEAEREALIHELEARNDELERFTYTVSHDLKAPLITIRGFLGLLEQDVLAGDVEQLQADMARIVEATDKMRRLLNELLELSRIGRLMNPPENVAFAAIVQEALQLVRGRFEGREVQVTVAPDLPMVRGDRARCVEVVQNLVDNACKFMGDQPEPKITLGRSGTDRDGKPILFVQDNGIGIDPQYQEKVFDLFDKLDPKSEGTGIGLALVKRIVEVHGGRIWVESSGLGQGSTFYFSLPTASE